MNNDITFCVGYEDYGKYAKSCPLKEKCQRYLIEFDGVIHISWMYAPFSYIDNKCKYFMQKKKELIRKRNR